MYFKNSLGFNNQKDIFNNHEKSYWSYVFAFLLAIEMGIGDSKKKMNIMDCFHMLNKELQLKMLWWVPAVVQWVKNPTAAVQVAAEMWVRSPAWRSGLKAQI